MALLLVLIVVTEPFCETAAVPLATPLSWTAAPAVGARAAAMGAMAQHDHSTGAKALLNPAGGCDCFMDSTIYEVHDVPQ